MAAPTSTTILLFYIFFTFLASDSASEQVRPHITDCFSTNMETFRCRWSRGALHNLSAPGDLRLFYNNKQSMVEWVECPHYSTDTQDECFFNENYTTIWTNYRVQLRSRDQNLIYDDSVFSVYDRVRPDPPYNLNWTPLNMSLSGQYYDIMLTWKPPESADVKSGWMTLQYQVQHRVVSSDLWKESNLLDSTHSTVFGLHTTDNYEVRVRCKMHGGKEFGGFSNSVFIHVPSKVSRFPMAAVLIFGALCLVAILMLVIISQQQKLMVLLLPQVPGPKIRGIDPELLKKGKLRELNSILGPSDLRPELYSAEPWAEFIELDLGEQHDMLTHLDTHRLVPHSLCAHDSPNSAAFRDDDSGRASCCEPDLHSYTENFPLGTMEETRSPETPELSTFSQLNREAMYTQVSEVRPSGNVVLSPEEQSDSEKDIMKDIFVADTTGYTSELNAGKISQSVANFGTGSSSLNSEKPLESARDVSSFPPAPVYTIVESVNSQNSLLLTPNTPLLVIPKLAPDGYLTPDLLGSITP